METEKKTLAKHQNEVEKIIQQKAVVESMKAEVEGREHKLNQHLADLEKREAMLAQETAQLQLGMEDIQRGLDRLEDLEERERQLESREASIVQWETKLRLVEGDLESNKKVIAEEQEAARRKVQPLKAKKHVFFHVVTEALP